MNWKFFRVLLIVTIIGTPTAFLLFWVFIKYKKYEGKEYYEKIKNSKRAYCYDLSRKALNPSFFVEDSAYAKDLKNYYDKVNMGQNPPFNFPLKFVVLFKKVYIVSNSKENDPEITEFVDFDTACYGYVHGYTYTKNLYNKLPDSSYTKHYQEITDSIQNTPENKRIKRLKRNGISQYGIQCDCNW